MMAQMQASGSDGSGSPGMPDIQDDDDDGESDGESDGEGPPPLEAAEPTSWKIDWNVGLN